MCIRDSGYKVSADDLVKLQRIRKAAEQGEFDILLVFMYDRLGRNLNEKMCIRDRCWFSNGYKMVFFHNRTTRTNVL